MSETASICSLTVSKNGDVNLRYENKEYTSEVLTDRRLRLVVDRFDRLAKEHQEVCRQEDLVLLGDTLFGLLFGQPATQVLASDSGARSTTPLDGKTLGDVLLGIVDAHKAGGRTTRLRLDLVFEEGADIWASLPWEFLYAFRPDNAGFFIAGKGASLSLTRFIKPPSERHEPADPPHMLVILAQPRELFFELPRADFDALMGAWRTYLRLPVGCAEPLIEATWEELTLRLGDASKPVPDIIHFIGHGRFYGGRSQVALHRSKSDMDAERAEKSRQAFTSQGELTEADWRNIADLKEQLRGRPPWLFFLQTCNTGRADPEFGAFRSAAQQIALADVPFVVAMQYEITATDAKIFANDFYAELGSGSSVDEAVMRGRESLGRISPSYGHPRFATPVVYLRSEHRVLVHPRSSDGSGTSPASIWPQFCPRCTQQLTDRRRFCKCDKRIALAYCTSGHVNVAGTGPDCDVYDCAALVGTERPASPEAPSTPSRPDVA